MKGINQRIHKARKKRENNETNMKGKTKDETGNRDSADEKKEAWKQMKKEGKKVWTMTRIKKGRKKEEIYDSTKTQ